MIIDSALAATEHKRRQIPAPLLEHLIESCRNGVSRVTVAVLDQLAPQLELRRRSARSGLAVQTLYMPTIADAIRSICYLAPPADIEAPILTMAPDPVDHAALPPQKVVNQWRSQVEGSCDGTSGHSWRGVPFGAVSRVHGYRLIARSPFIIRTRSVEPYANVWITVNPSASQVLRRLPLIAPPRLLAYLSQAGHGNGVAIVPASFGNLFACGADTVQVNASVDEIAQAVASLWEPDAYTKHPEDPLQRAFGIHHLSPHPGAIPQLPHRWNDPAVQQLLSEEQMQQALHNDLVGMMVLAHGGGSSAFLMTNGISGHNGGF